MLSLGVTALIGGLASYGLAFALFERENKWNFRAWTTFGLLLALTGMYLPLPLAGFWSLCCFSCVLCSWLNKKLRLPTLGIHSAMYLALGSVAATATLQPAWILFGADRIEDWRAPLLVIASAWIAWMLLPEAQPDGQGRRRTQISSLFFVAHISWILIGVLTVGLVAMWGLVFGRAPQDTIATAIVVGVSLTLAWLAKQPDRQEFAWVLYALMAMGAYKLVARDFQNEHSLALVASLLSYGGALIVLPRMLRA